VTTTELSLSRAAARGAAWSYATFLVSKGLALISTLVLARILAPEEFGLIALALVFMGYLDIVNDFGIISAVIWRRGDVERTARVAFGLTLLVGAGLSVLSLFAAPVVADFYDEPRLAGLLRVLSVTFLLVSFGSVQDALLRRAMAFRRRFVAEAVKAVVKAAVTVGFAATGFGAWSVVHGQLAGVTVGAIAYWLLVRWRPSFTLDRRLARDLLGYGSQLTLLGLLAMAVSSADQIAIGRRLGAAELGFYAVAFRLPGLLVLNSCSVLSQALFPAFARVRDGDGSMPRALVRAVQLLAALTVPLGLGIALVAPDLVSVLFGERWQPATPVMRWLAVHTVLATLLYNDGDVYKATGRPIVLNALTAVQLGLTAPVMWWAAGRGITTAAASMVAISATVLVLRAGLVHRLLGVSVRELGRALLPVVLSAGVMAGAVGLARAGLSDAPAAMRLTASVAVGLVSYGAALRLCARQPMTEALSLFRLRGGGGAPAPAPAMEVSSGG